MLPLFFFACTTRAPTPGQGHRRLHQWWLVWWRFRSLGRRASTHPRTIDAMGDCKIRRSNFQRRPLRSL
jgi:hypothetical protein